MFGIRSNSINHNANLQSPGLFSLKLMGNLLMLSGLLAGAVLPGSLHADAAARTGSNSEALSDTINLSDAGIANQLNSVIPPSSRTLSDESIGSIETTVTAEERVAKVAEPQFVALMENSILNQGGAGSSIDSSTVLESKKGVVLSFPETRVEPTELDERILTNAEVVLPEMGVVLRNQKKVDKMPEVTNDLKTKIVSDAVPQSPLSGEDGAGLSYAIILALFALISLIPVARRNNDHHHHV